MSVREDTNISFREILEIIVDPSSKDYKVPYWGEDKQTTEGKLEYGNKVSLGTKSCLVTICGIVRTSMDNVFNYYKKVDKGEKGLTPPNIQPKFFINVAQLLIILDDQGTPLKQPKTKKPIVFRPYAHPHTGQTIEPWQQLQSLHFSEIGSAESLYSDFIDAYYKNPGGYFINDSNRTIKEEFKENQYKSAIDARGNASNISPEQLRGAVATLDGLETKRIAEITQLLSSVDPQTANKILQLVKGEDELDRLGEMLSTAKREYGCSSTEEFASYISDGEKSGDPLYEKTVKVLRRIENGEQVSVETDPPSILTLLSLYLKDDSGQSFGGDVDSMLSYAYKRNGTRP